MSATTRIESIAALRALYATPQERAVRKQIPRLDVHCRGFIALSPFVILATTDAAHHLDASPRGGPPGFVKVTEEGDLLLPTRRATTASTRSRTSSPSAGSVCCS